ncbi:TPA: hypothetical protein N0F65_011924 [Lagenidium giganteum]|uniref:Alpha-MPP n=1 Tax=Lagenidium giganteum TaxID=4803 RepID=A0AAV2YUU4_9STRA|nr:TPA: hypothetical protein N0F65_011924 [Lagenidium giganteum]
MLALGRLGRASAVALRHAGRRADSRPCQQFARCFSVADNRGAAPEVVDPSAILRPERPADAKPQFSLHNELPDLPQLKPACQLEAPRTQVTTLPSGLRVISHDTYGQAATVGMFIDAGSRFEDETNAGSSHLLEHLAFKTTSKRSHAQLVSEVEDIGALTTASCGREQIIYTVDLLRDNVERGLELLADSVLNVQYVPEEIEQIKTIMEIQTEDLFENPQALLQEYIHAAAYGSDSPLGRPLQCPVDQIGRLTIDAVKDFRDKHFVAEKMVLAGSGVDHETLVRHAEKLFADVPRAGSQPVIKATPAVYKGGIQTLDNPESMFSYAAIAFPTGGWHDKDLVPMCVLHTLLGGGDSFSAGGPGKGMYSRLYTSVLNRFYWVESAFAFSSIHADVGLMGIYGACVPSHTSNLVALLCNQLLHVANKKVDEVELSRARNQLKSSVLMNLESRMILYEDIGRQLLTYGYRESPESVCAKIDQVTADDIQRVVQQALEHPPSLVYSGDLQRFPQYEHVVAGLQEGLRAPLY